MRNDELIEKFIKDNFDLTQFDLSWENDWKAHLKDFHGNKLSIITFNPEEIWTMINDVKYLKYRLTTCRCTGEETWVVVND